jgi:hypothetical protein
MEGTEPTTAGDVDHAEWTTRALRLDQIARLNVVSFADGTAMVVVPEGGHEDAERLLAHLAERGFARRTG